MNRYVSIKIGADLRGEISTKKNSAERHVFLMMLTVKKWDI